MRKEFVLVHGAWHGAWCWSEVKALLESQGHSVHAPDLPGHGDDTGGIAAATMDNYIARVRETVDACAGPVILVGHSMGGMVISAVAELCPQRIERLVYLCAFVPQGGESLMQLGSLNLASSIRGNQVPSPDGQSVSLRSEVIRQALFHDCDAETAMRAEQQLCPQSIEPVGAVVSLGERFESVAKHYIECIEDQTVHIATQRFMARRANCSLVTSLNTGHSPFLASPEAVVIALLSDTEA